MRQIALLPAGIHRIGNNVLHANSGFFYYRSTMAVYVVKRNPGVYNIEKILCVSDRSILSMTFSPHDENLMTTYGADGNLTLWSMKDEKVLNRCSIPKDSVVMLDWDPLFPSNVLKVSHTSGGLRVHRWDVYKAASHMHEIYALSDRSIVPLVVKASPSVTNKLAVGCSDGKVYLFDLGSTRVYAKLHDKSFPTSAAIVDMKWDALSAQYLLVAYDTFVSMWDVTTSSLIQLFEKQNVSISSIAWLEWAPGSFLTSTSKTGILKLWNVSQKVPLESLRAVTGDGSFHVYNVMHKHTEYKTSTSHSETIFNCAFSPVSFDQFATCSYDGTIRVWKLADMSLMQYLQAGDGIIYSVCWSPNGSMLAGSTIQGTVIIWDLISSREVARFKNHTKASFSVAWNTISDRMLVSTSSDGSAVVFEVLSELLDEAGNGHTTGSETKKQPTKPAVLIRFAHPAPVFGCAWSPNRAKVFCTGCQDSIVRVFDYGIGTSPKYTLLGHSARVFNCVWSPLVENLLATGSDDLNIHIWDLDVHSPGDTGAIVRPKRTLSGHTSNVRALSWNYEHKDILLSGSWDRSIKVWDIVNGVCIRSVSDHAADVYALVSHPRRPFAYLSCSRDSTVRLWLLDCIASHFKVIAILDESFARIRIAEEPAPGRASSFLGTHRALTSHVESNGAPSPPKQPITLATSPSILSQSKHRSSSTLPAITHSAASVNVVPAVFSLSTVESRRAVSDPRLQPTLADYTPLTHMLRGLESAKISAKLNQIGEIGADQSDWEGSLRRAEKFYNIFSLFGGSISSMDLWESVLYVLAKKTSKTEGAAANVFAGMLLRPKSEMIVALEGDIITKSRSDARKLESVKMNRKGVPPSSRVADKLREAAMINATIGDFERYCKIMVDLGEWTSALAMAPMVSMELWSSLCSQYSDHLLQQANEDCVPYLLAAGRDKDAANFYLSRGDVKSSLVVAKASESVVSSKYVRSQHEESKNPSVSLTSGVVGRVAELECEVGRATMGAAHILACSGDFEAAIELLIATYEYELAYAISLVFQVDLAKISNLLVYKCTAEGLISAAVELSQKFDSTDVSACLLISFTCITEEQAVTLLSAHNLPSLSSWREKANVAKESNGAVEDIVGYLVCSRQFSHAAQLACAFLKKHIREPFDSTALTLVQHLKHLQFVGTEGVEAASRIPVLSIMFWCCSFQAAKQGLYEIAWNMLRILRASSVVILGLTPMDLMLQEFLFRLVGGDRSVGTFLNDVSSNEQMSAQCLDYLSTIRDLLKAFAEPADIAGEVKNLESADDVSELQQIWGSQTSQLFREAQKLSDTLSLPSFWSYQTTCRERFKRVAEGSTLPSACISSSVQCSYITQRQIMGVPVTLEDGITSISVNDALSWTRILSFSPLMTGERIKYIV